VSAPLASISGARVRHALTVPVRIDDAIDARFVVDTGMGMELLSAALFDRLGLSVLGERRGRRMSGQEIAVPYARVASLTLGPLRREGAEVARFDVRGLPAELADVGGFLSLRFFETTPFTLEANRDGVVLESEGSLAARVAHGTAVDVRVVRRDAAVEAFLAMDVGAKEPAEVEIDTGSDALILDLRYAAALGMDLGTARTTTGIDETGVTFVRHVARMPTPIFPVAAPAFRQIDAPVIFQRIVHDGLVGHSFLGRSTVTYDLPRSRLILARP
jgi:hypothetical protein